MVLGRLSKSVLDRWPVCFGQASQVGFYRIPLKWWADLLIPLSPILPIHTEGLGVFLFTIFVINIWTAVYVYLNWRVTCY